MSQQLRPLASTKNGKELGKTPDKRPARSIRWLLIDSVLVAHAKLASDPETKRQFEVMARQWLALSKQPEKNGGY
jgi:hypothetical protein